MTRAYTDVVAEFNRGRAGSRVRRGDYFGASDALAVDDPDAAAAYRRMGREEEQGAYSRAYGSDYASGNFEAAATRAGKFGDMQGVGAARDAQATLSQQERENAGRRALGYLDGIDAVERAPESERSVVWQQWLNGAMADADESGRQFLQSLPRDFNPRAIGNLRTRLQRAVDQMLPASELLARRQGGNERRYTGASGGILDTYTGQVNPNPYYVRGGSAQDGPPAPPDGYRIVGGQ